MDIDAIKSRLAATHKGPWRVAEAGAEVLQLGFEQAEPCFDTAEDDCIVGPDGEEVLGCSEWLRVEREDLEFMAHARQDIEDLVGEVERLSARVMELEEALIEECGTVDELEAFRAAHGLKDG